MPEILVEVCCGNPQDAFTAQQAGAGRIELNMALPLGGLTPSVGLLQVAKQAGIPVIAMIRPRESGFLYSEAEFQAMLLDAKALVKAGADGVAFGFLRADSTIDTERCQKLLEQIGPAQSVFHRAVDLVPSWRDAIDTLCGLGVQRILTSGQQPTALAGAQTLRDMIQYAAGRLEVLPAGGIRQDNVAQLIALTGCTQVHASFQSSYADPSVPADSPIRFGGALPPSEEEYRRSDLDKIQAFVRALPQ